MVGKGTTNHAINYQFKIAHLWSKIVLVIKLLSDILAKNKSIYSTSLFIKSFSESIIDKDKKAKG